MWLRFAMLILISSCAWQLAEATDDLTSMCPKPSHEIQAGCRQITYKDLPVGAKALLRKLKCDVRSGSNYDFGSAVDLNGNGSPEYQFCCHEAPHGPCDAVLISKIGLGWKDLTAKDGLLGFEGACNGFIVLESQQRRFHDLCLPLQCSSPDKSTCAPTIWRYDGNHYRSTETITAKPTR